MPIIFDDDDVARRLCCYYGRHIGADKACERADSIAEQIAVPEAKETALECARESARARELREALACARKRKTIKFAPLTAPHRTAPTASRAFLCPPLPAVEEEGMNAARTKNYRHFPIFYWDGVLMLVLALAPLR